MTNRDCGSCDVCCIVPGIDHPELIKEPNVVCPNLNQSKSCEKCKIYETRPEGPCAGFECSWKLGYGNEDDIPNKNNLLTTMRSFNNGDWIIAIETAGDAVQTTGRSMVVDLVQKFDLVVIVQSYDAEVDTGDRTVIKNSMLSRATAMTGDFIEWLDEDETIGLYDLVNPG